MTPPIAVVGPTATGKSDLAVELALRLDGEVVNADAMQLYRGMDVGTAKITAAERRGVPHHLLYVLDVTETASVAAYQRASRAAVDAVLAAGRVPVLVGVSNLLVAFCNFTIMYFFQMWFEVVEGTDEGMAGENLLANSVRMSNGSIFAG